MRRLSILTLMLLCAAVSLRAQSLDAFKQRLAEPVAGTAFFGRAQVTVAEHGDAARAVAEGAGEEADRLNRTIIERECAAYILDKADALGISAADAAVTARWSEEGFWYPWESRVSCPEGGRAALSEAIEAELGIPPERQSWEEGT